MSQYRKEVEKVAAVVQHIACSHEGCPDPAMTRNKYNAPICRRHWDLDFKKETSAELKRLDLLIREEKIAHCREMAKKMQRNFSGDGNREWAKKLLQRYEDGEYMDMYPVDLAKRSLGVQ